MLCSREILNFLIRKDVKKILKRKDSDAGQRGKALEDLRASIFNKFRSSESAKRQQQRICGPVAALTFNFMVAVGIIFMNKWVLKNVGFQFPVFLTFIHYAMAKIAVTPSIVLAEFIWYKKKVTFSKAIIIVHQVERSVLVPKLEVVSIGVAIATVTDLQFSLFGACVAVAWIIPSAVNKILWSNMQQQENWTALSLMWKTTPITLLFLVSMIPFLDPPGVLAFHWSFNNTSAILVSAFLGFLLQWSGALALGATSAISHVVLGQFKTCVILLGSFYLFGSNPGTTSIIGAFIAIGGMSFFTYLNLRDKKQQPQPGLQVSSALPKSKLSEGNGDICDGFGTETV
ncbi:hypothetical protein GOBAR_DD12336 [Gossypium barbadense]|nr:hypothetical protein GOBAR_DD12336 [Gossypium barbadense]